MTIADQLLLVAATKTAIRDAIEAKGQVVGAAPFAEYPAKVAAITSGGGASVNARYMVMARAWDIDGTPLYDVFPAANAVATVFNVSPCGRYVAYAGPGNVYLLHAKSLDPVWELAVPLVGTAVMCAFSPDGNTLVVCSNYVAVIDTSTGVRRAVDTPLASRAAFTPDGATLLLTNGSILYQLETTGYSEVATRVTLSLGQVNDMQVSRDGLYVAFAHGNSPYFTMFTIATGTALPAPTQPPPAVGLCLAFSPTRDSVVVGCSAATGAAKGNIYTVPGLVRETTISWTGATIPTAISFTDDGVGYVVSDATTGFDVVRVKYTTLWVSTQLGTATSKVQRVSPDGSSIYSIEGTRRACSNLDAGWAPMQLAKSTYVTTGVPMIVQYPEPGGPIMWVGQNGWAVPVYEGWQVGPAQVLDGTILAAHGRTLVSCPGNYLVFYTDGQPVRTVSVASSATFEVGAAEFSRDGSLLATGLVGSPYLAVVDVAAMTLRPNPSPTLSNRVTYLSFTADATRLLARNSAFYEYDTTTMAAGTTPGIAASGVSSSSLARYSPDGKWLVVSSSSTPRMRLQNLATGAVDNSPGGYLPLGQPTGLRFTEDGKWMVYGDSSNAAHDMLVNLNTFAVTTTLYGAVPLPPPPPEEP